MVVVAMMNGKFLDVCTRKFPTATSTNPWIHFKRLLTIALLPLSGASIGIGNELVQSIIVKRRI